MAVYGYDPYDPEQIRRRQMLEDAVQTNPPSGPPAEMPDDPGDDDDGLGGASGAANNQPAVKMTEAQQRYKSTVDAMPKAENYQPSKWRRFGAALAGGLAGMRNPEAGYNLGQEIAGQPLKAAMSNWQNSMTQANEGLTLDKTQQAQAIAQQRANSYQISAQARVKQAEATEAWRKKEALKWAPETKEEAIQFEQSKHNPPAPRRPTPFEEYKSDPNGFARYQSDLKAGKTQPITFEQRKELEQMRLGGQAAHDKRLIDARVPKNPPAASPADQEKAEQQAISQLLRTNPEYAAYVDKGGVSTNALGVSHTKPHRVKSVDELPKAGQPKGWFGEALGGATGLKSPLAQYTTDTEASLARERYNQFLTDLHKAKQRVLGTTKTGGVGGDWIIEEEQ